MNKIIIGSILLCGVLLHAGVTDWVKSRASDVRKKVVSGAEKVESVAVSGAKKVESAYEKSKEFVITEGKEAYEIAKEDALRLYLFMRGSNLDSFKQELNAKNPYQDFTARVRSDAPLSQEEQDFQKKRAFIAQRALEDFLGTTLNPEDIKGTIAVVASGGGYRALLETLGFTKGLEEIGLLPAVSYFSALSGSTWFLAPWIFSGQSVARFQEQLFEKNKKDRFNFARIQTPFNVDMHALVSDIIWPKYVFGQPIGSVDIYGALLAFVLFHEHGSLRQKLHITQQWPMIADGGTVFPIYTAISMHKENETYRYNWYGINPIEIENLEIGAKPAQGERLLRFPSYAFGSRFENGFAGFVAPEQSMGFIIAIAGAAYDVNIKDLYRIKYEGSADEKKSTREKLEYMIAKTALGAAQDIKRVGTARVAPAQILNPFKGMPEVPAWLSGRDKISLYDAGIDYNLPIRPVLLRDRNVRLIFMFDASNNALVQGELGKMFDDVKRIYGYTYTRVDDQTTPVMHFYKDLNNDDAPRIIYLNFAKDNALLDAAEQDPDLRAFVEQYNLRQFDPEKCLEEFCSTFNFSYSNAEIATLTGITDLYVRVLKDKIREFMRSELIS